MASKRSGWYQVHGKWTRALGERGCRVRLFQMTKGGAFFRTVWVAGRGTDRKSLNTTDRLEAERLGRTLVAALLSGRPVTAPPALRLGELWRRFSSTCPTHLDNSPRTQLEAAQKARVLLAHFGAVCLVRNLTADDQAAYVTARRAGRIQIGPEKDDVTGPVRGRAIEADLALLHRMLRWATTVRVNGERLLDVHPLAGVRRAREVNPHRPVATWERFLATRAAMQRLAAAAETKRVRDRWVRAEFALVLAEATGRRLGSIRQLRWEDFDVDRGVIRWRAEADKKGRDSEIPIAPTLVEAIRQFRRTLSAVGGWVFPAEEDPDVAADRYAFDAWLRTAEKKAELPKLVGGLWHAYRRKWATERKALPLPDVAEAGGWKDVTTLLTCYQRSTNDALLAVMTEERKVRDVAVVRRAEGAS